MLRRFSGVCLAAFTVVVAACGHQVSPIPTAAQSDLSGDIVVRFKTASALDFQHFIYVVAVDMCGTGVPYPNALVTGYQNYTYAFLVGGGFGNSAEPLLYEYYLNSSNAALTKIPIYSLSPSVSQFLTPYNGQNNEFEFIFRRNLLNNPFDVALPCPNSQPVPVSTTTLYPTATPAAAAHSSATPMPSPAPSSPSPPAASPSPPPLASGDNSTGVNSPFYLTSWTFNLMTFSAGTVAPIDDLYYSGPNDVSSTGIVVDTTISREYAAYPPPGKTLPQNPASQITYGEIDTYPL